MRWAKGAMVKRMILFAIVTVVCCIGLWGDTIKFKDGTEVYGRIVAEMGDTVMILIQGKAEKVSRDTILKIIKGDIPKAEPKQKEPRFQIGDMGDTPLAEIAADLKSWREKIEPLRTRYNKDFHAASVASTIDDTDALYLWLPKWAEEGVSLMGLDDIRETLQILKWIRRPLKEDIKRAVGPNKCSACRGSNRSACRKCRGSGKVSAGTSVGFRIGKSGVSSKKAKKSKKCSACRGSGRAACQSVIHVADKRVKTMGGMEKAAEFLLLVERQYRALPKLMRENSRLKTAEQRKEFAGNLYRQKYYYMAMEILKEIGEKNEREGDHE